MPNSERITAEEVGQSPDRPRARQAVVIIHGIGEQQPMNTLRSFISGFYPVKPDGKLHVFSKPDRISAVLDLRRMTASAKVTGNPTDFYELYWAHLMQGTTWAHLLDWFAVLMFRSRDSVPERLSGLFRWCWAAAGVLLVIFAGLLLAGPLPIIMVAGAGAPLWPFLRIWLRWVSRKYALSYLGDAARYLRPAPENIGRRQAIRNAGLDVLRRLHDEPMQRYDRIVVVGHSLGSVIAYDILTHLWQEMHWQHTKPVNPDQPCYEEMKRRLVSVAGSVGDFDCFRTLQKELLKEEQALGMPWKITDLITVGSPLTYADFLLADTKYPIDRRRQDRELPTCPPQLEDARDIGFLSPSYRLKDGPMETKKLLHHAALFACTRWTNIYFRSDIVGGPLHELFGDGIKDVPLTGCSAASKTAMAHVRYWDAREPEACDAVKKAMCLCEVEAGPHQ